MARYLAALVLAFALSLALGFSAQAQICKTLKGEWVGFGEDSPRKEAQSRLDKEIAAWGARYGLPLVKPRNRKVSCKVYLQALNEYECTAEAMVCR
jgi:hypothetical protein